MGSKGQDSTFTEHDHVAYQNQGITCAALWWQNFCLQTPNPMTLGLESKGQNSTFSEHGHYAYQIKGNYNCRNMVAKNLPVAPPPPTPLELGQKITEIHFSSEHDHVAYLIKRNYECSNIVANIWPADPTTLGDWFERSKFNFLEHSHVAYQIKLNHKCSNMVANILRADPLPRTYDPGEWVNRSNFNFFRIWLCCISN